MDAEQSNVENIVVERAHVDPLAHTNIACCTDCSYGQSAFTQLVLRPSKIHRLALVSLLGTRELHANAPLQ